MRSSWSKTGPESFPYKKDTHTHPWKSKGKIAPQSFQREASPAATLISNFWPPELRENKSLVLCHLSLWLLVAAVLGNQCTALQGQHEHHG